MHPFSEMGAMKLLVITLSLSVATAEPLGYSYNISSYLDVAIEEFKLKVLRAGDEYVALEDPVTIGGFVLTRPKLADMSSLERVRDAWLKPRRGDVEVTAEFKFGKLHLDGWNLTGPGMNLEKPRISARDNLLKVKFLGHIETTSSWPTADGPRVVTKNCFPTYRASLESLSSVVLVTRDGVRPLDEWSTGFFPEISEIIVPFVEAAFQEHFDLCRSLKINGYNI